MLCAWSWIRIANTGVAIVKSGTMSQITINLPDDLQPLAEARAAESGHSSIATYVESLVRYDAEVPSIDCGAPAHLTVRSRAELEAALREGLASPMEPVTPDDWAELRRAISEP
jgi:hypothetical protein